MKFITLTTRSGKLLVNPKNISWLQDLNENSPQNPKTSVFAGGIIFVMESVQEILDTCEHYEDSKMVDLEKETAKEAGRALEKLSTARHPKRVSPQGEGNAQESSGVHRPPDNKVAVTELRNAPASLSPKRAFKAFKATTGDTDPEIATGPSDLTKHRETDI